MNGYFLDTNILSYLRKEHPVLCQHIDRVSWDRIHLPSVVVAESWRGRLRQIDGVPKEKPEQALFPDKKLIETHELLRQFKVAPFDKEAANRLLQLQQDARRRKKGFKKRHADMMIAAMTLSYDYILVTRNERDFADLLPIHQVENWIDD